MKPQRLRIVGSVVTLFAVANLVSYYQMLEYPPLDDGFVYFGWPFSIYVEGGFVGQAAIIWTGLIGNAFVALGFGRILERFFEKRVQPANQKPILIWQNAKRLIKK
jgi:hypothetical protein